MTQQTDKLGELFDKYYGNSIRVANKKDFISLCQSPELKAVIVGESLQLRISDWQDETFPKSTATSKLNHLAKEIIELSDAIKEDDHFKIQEEVADCIHLLFGIASKCGFNAIQATEDKFAINQKREWGKPDENGVVEHIKKDPTVDEYGISRDPFGVPYPH